MTNSQYHSRVFCAIATHSHLHFIAALADSLRESGNSEALHVLVPTAARVEELPEPWEGVFFHSLGDLLFQPPAEMRFYFDAFELSNALKPFIVKHLLDDVASHVIYLDADLFVTGSFTKVWNDLETTSLLVSPHHLTPPPKLPHTDEIAIVDQGMLNGGFAAWRASDGATRILDWMCKSFPIHGFCDRAAGMFVDQKLIPLALIYFPDAIEISRNPCLNIAFWNFHERPVTSRADGWWIDNSQVIFFHMSGYRLERPDVPCSYLSAASNATILANHAWFKEVMDRYSALLQKNLIDYKSFEYPYGHFGNIVLNPSFRRILFRGGKLDWSNPSYRRAWFVHQLRLIKRKIVRFIG